MSSSQVIVTVFSSRDPENEENNPFQVSNTPLRQSDQRMWKQPKEIYFFSPDRKELHS